MRGALREFAGILDEAEGLLWLRALAKTMYDLARGWMAKLATRECLDMKLLACRLQKHVLSTVKVEDEEPGLSLSERHFLCTSFCHTATDYQTAGDLQAALLSCTEAKMLMKQLEESEHKDLKFEEINVTKHDLLFRELEIVVANDDGEESQTRSFALLGAHSQKSASNYNFYMNRSADFGKHHIMITHCIYRRSTQEHQQRRHWRKN